MGLKILHRGTELVRSGGYCQRLSVDCLAFRSFVLISLNAVHGPAARTGTITKGA
jgi:hypothetical protein